MLWIGARVFMMRQIEYELRNSCRMPALGLGTWLLKGAKCRQVVSSALKLGYRHIDTAEMYGNHHDIGEALKGFDRSEIFLTSKVSSLNLRHDDVIEACDRALAELGSGYIDLYLIHWPNPQIPLRETLAAFGELLKDGKIRSAGVSNFSTNLLKDALETAEFPLTVNQVEFHPQEYSRELLRLCKENGLILVAYSPLGRGQLLQDRMIREIAEERGRTSAQICLRWGLQKGAAVIPKASSETHLRENMDVFDWTLTEEDMRRLDSLT